MTIRRIIGPLITILTGLMLFPVVGEFFVELAKERGWYEQPSAKVKFVIDGILAVTDLPGFYPALSFAAGLSIAYWLLQWLALPSKGAEKTTSTETYLRLQFGTPPTLPVAENLSNIWRWYALANVRVLIGPNGEQRRRTEFWTVFLTLDRPVDVKQVIVETSSGVPPIYEVKDRDARSVVVVFNGDMADRLISIRVVAGSASVAPALALQQVARDYFPAEKARLSELLATISEQLNNKGLQVVRAPWIRMLQTDRTNVQLDEHISEIDTTIATIEELVSDIWTRTIPENPKYEKELMAIVGQFDGTNPLSHFQGWVNVHRREIERFRTEQISDVGKHWIAELLFYRQPQEVLMPRAAAVQSWIDQCNAKIAQERTILK